MRIWEGKERRQFCVNHTGVGILEKADRQERERDKGLEKGEERDGI
jgi:hypothetical protein